MTSHSLRTTWFPIEGDSEPIMPVDELYPGEHVELRTLARMFRMTVEQLVEERAEDDLPEAIR